MIEISEPLPNSEIGYRTLHNISINGRHVGFIDVGYLRKEDLKTFQKYTKRKLKPGQPFGVQVFIDATKGIKANELEPKILLEIVEALKKRFAGLEDRDIYIMELEGENKRIIGKATSLKP